VAPRKSAKKVAEAAIESLEKVAEAKTTSAAEKVEIKEAIAELEDVLGAAELSEDQQRQIIGYNVETGAPVFMPKF
jgi:hypothetical protein